MENITEQDKVRKCFLERRGDNWTIATLTSIKVKLSDQATQTFGVVGPSWKYTEDEIKKGSLLMFSSLKTYKLLRSFGDGRYPSPRTVREGFNDVKSINKIGKSLVTALAFWLRVKTAAIPYQPFIFFIRYLLRIFWSLRKSALLLVFISILY